MTWESAIVSNQQALNSLSNAQLKTILPVLKEVQVETKRGLAHWMKSIPLDDTYTMHRHRALIASMTEALHTIERRLGKAALDDIILESKRAGSKAMKNLNSMINAGDKKYRDAISSLNLDHAAAMLDAQKTLMTRFSSSAKRYAGGVGANIRHRMAVGLVKGETCDQLVRRLADKPDQLWKRMSVDQKAGAGAQKQFFTSKADAERLVRTESNNFYNETQVEGLRQAEADDPGWFKKWDAANDARTCSECASLDGQVVGLDETFKGGIDHPPLHPSDRCGIVPFRKDWK